MQRVMMLMSARCCVGRRALKGAVTATTTTRPDFGRSVRAVVLIEKLCFSSASSTRPLAQPQEPQRRVLPPDGLTFGHFLDSSRRERSSSLPDTWSSVSPYHHPEEDKNDDIVTKFHIKTYGCQMNVNDSDIVRSLLFSAGTANNNFVEVDDENEADVLFTNTCAIREGAEQKVWTRLHQWRARNKERHPTSRNKKIIGVLGCMAERLKEDLLKAGVADLVVGPDAYRDVPKLVSELLALADKDSKNKTKMNVQLSRDETYADITPVRHHQETNHHAAFVSIQRGCSNRCSFCIVPYTRGVERSRPLDSIVDEVKRLHYEHNVQEITLLGQNVNSYHDRSPQALLAQPGSTATAAAVTADPHYQLSNDGFRSRSRRPTDAGYWFADLLAAVADVNPDQLRVRFTSPHPKDYPTPLLQLMAERANICNQLHLPAQSGSTTMLKRMKRGYTREAYLRLVDDVRHYLPDVGLSSDFIAGFCDETEDEHADTVSLLEHVRYDQAYMFAYSMREPTHASRTMSDNVPANVKQRRLQEIIDSFNRILHEKNATEEVGRVRLVLVEGEATKKRKGSDDDNRVRWRGSTDQNKQIVFPVDPVEEDGSSGGFVTAQCWTDKDVRPLLDAVQTGVYDTVSTSSLWPHWNNHSPTIGAATGLLRPGDYAVVYVTAAEGGRLRGRLLWRTDSITRFQESGLGDRDAESRQRSRAVAQALATLADDENGAECQQQHEQQQSLIL